MQYDIALIKTKDAIPRERILPLCDSRYPPNSVTLGVCGFGATNMSFTEAGIPRALMETFLHEEEKEKYTTNSYNLMNGRWQREWENI